MAGSALRQEEDDDEEEGGREGLRQEEEEEDAFMSADARVQCSTGASRVHASWGCSVKNCVAVRCVRGRQPR